MDNYQVPETILCPKVNSTDELRRMSPEQLLGLARDAKLTKVHLINYIARCDTQTYKVAEALRQKAVVGNRWEGIARDLYRLSKKMSTEVDVSHQCQLG